MNTIQYNYLSVDVSFLQLEKTTPCWCRYQIIFSYSVFLIGKGSGDFHVCCPPR